MLNEISFEHTAMSIGELINWALDEGDSYHGYKLNLNPPYQRGAVWTDEQKRDAILSLLQGIPLGNIFVNHSDKKHYTVRPSVVDGQQRILALTGFFKGEFTVPTSWFDDREQNPDNPLVPLDYEEDEITYGQLTRLAQMDFRQRKIAVSESNVQSIEEEARIFNLVNFHGTAMTEEDAARARDIAGDDDTHFQN
jgi:Protein of unknown function DUF262